MTHLTITGRYAGLTLCGAARTTEDKYVHAAYAPESVLRSKDCCEKCREVWEKADMEADI